MLQLGCMRRFAFLLSLAEEGSLLPVVLPSSSFCSGSCFVAAVCNLALPLPLALPPRLLFVPLRDTFFVMGATPIAAATVAGAGFFLGALGKPPPALVLAAPFFGADADVDAVAVLIGSFPFFCFRIRLLIFPRVRSTIAASILRPLKPQSANTDARKSHLRKIGSRQTGGAHNSSSSPHVYSLSSGKSSAHP